MAVLGAYIYRYKGKRVSRWAHQVKKWKWVFKASIGALMEFYLPSLLLWASGLFLSSLDVVMVVCSGMCVCGCVYECKEPNFYSLSLSLEYHSLSLSLFLNWGQKEHDFVWDSVCMLTYIQAQRSEMKQVSSCMNWNCQMASWHLQSIIGYNRLKGMVQRIIDSSE